MKVRVALQMAKVEQSFNNNLTVVEFGILTVPPMLTPEKFTFLRGDR